MSVNLKISINDNMIKKQLPKKKILYKGKNVYYKTIPSLANKLKITKEQAKQLVLDINSGNTIKYFEKDGNIGKYDITTKPLFLRDFGIKKLTNKSLLTEKTIKGVDFAKSVPMGINLNLMINAKFQFQISQDIVIRSYTWNDSIASINITDNYLKETINHEYLSTIGGANHNTLKILTYNISSTFTEQKFNMVDMELYDTPTNLNINNLFNEVLEDKKWKDCVVDYIKYQYPKLGKKKIEKLRTINDLYLWSVDNDLKMLCYDINGSIIKSHYPIKKNKMKNLVFIAFNNHLYPLKNTTLNRTKNETEIEIKVINEDSGMKNLINELNNGVLPTKINFKNDTIISYNIGKIKYVDNKDYELCKEILTKFGCLDKLTPYTNLMNISTIIEEIYIKENIKSFIPKNSRFVKGGFNYHNINKQIEIDNAVDIKFEKYCEDKPLLKLFINTEEYERIKNKLEAEELVDYETIDKNKAYAYALSSLEYLIKVDLKCCKINLSLSKDHKIIKHNLYIVNPQQSSIYLPHTGIYSGEHINLCKTEGLKFEVREEIVCEKTPNYYKQLINDLYDRVDEKTFKTIMNVMIGKMERNKELQLNQTVSKIINKDEADRSEGYIKELRGSKYFMLLENNHSFDLFNQKPIAIQIKDASRVLIHRTLTDLKINQEDILQVKTDSITFKPKNKNHLKYIDNTLKGFKFEKYSNIEEPIIYDYDITFNYTSYTKNHISEFKNIKKIKENTNSNVLGNCYAGAGKTYTIINDLVPKIEKLNEDYIILTPSHSALKEYKKLRLSCAVIQSFSLRNIIPEDKHVIIDEIGMVDNAGWAVIYKLFLKNHKIYAYGDFKQLKPIDGNIYDNEIFLDYIFNKKQTITTNYRNNFTKEYYDNLINEKKQDKLIKEMKKYRTKTPYEADTIICYRNNTKDKYNALICKNKGIKSKTQIGAELIAICNDLRKDNIYNKFTYKVLSKTQDKITITDGIDDFIVNEDNIEKCFNYSYARTLYSVQGETLNSLYYPDEDLYFLDGRTTYTLISRLKYDLEDKQKETNKNYNDNAKPLKINSDTLTLISDNTLPQAPKQITLTF